MIFGELSRLYLADAPDCFNAQSVLTWLTRNDSKIVTAAAEQVLRMHKLQQPNRKSLCSAAESLQPPAKEEQQIAVKEDQQIVVEQGFSLTIWIISLILSLIRKVLFPCFLLPQDRSKFLSPIGSNTALVKRFCTLCVVYSALALVAFLFFPFENKSTVGFDILTEGLRVSSRPSQPVSYISLGNIWPYILATLLALFNIVLASLAYKKVNRLILRILSISTVTSIVYFVLLPFLFRSEGWTGGLKDSHAYVVSLSNAGFGFYLSVLFLLWSAFLAIYLDKKCIAELQEESSPRPPVNLEAPGIGWVQANAVPVDVVKDPQTLETYGELWSGFTGEYWAYNPSFQFEDRPGEVERADLITTVFVPRYKNKELKKAYYVFLTKDKIEHDDLDVFRSMMQEVKAQCSEIASKLRVRELQGENAVEDGEIYSGMKNGKLTSVVALREKSLVGGPRSANYYLVFHDDEINSQLRKYFKEAWSKGSEVDIFKQTSLEKG